MRSFLLLVLLFISQPAFSGEIAQHYAHGAFDTRWGDSIENVKAVFPTGKREAYKQVVMFVVRDGRPLFNVARKKNAFITFGFDPEYKLNSVAVEFQIADYEALLKSLDQQFGAHTMQVDDNTARIATWPRDDGIELSLTMSRAGFFSQEIKTSLNIIYTGLYNRD
jgi:hypothetical protein